jgi:hypothetical protein
MGPQVTRRNAVLRFDEPVLLSLLLCPEDSKGTSNVMNEDSEGVLIEAISAKKIANGAFFSQIRVRFYGQLSKRTATSQEEDKLCAQHELEIPSWWTARDFLAVLYTLTVGDSFWISQVETLPHGIFPIALVGLSRLPDAFDWAKSELEHIVWKYGALVVVHGGESS